MPKADHEDIKLIAAQYVSDRDNYATRYLHGQSGLFSSTASQIGFNRLLNGHADELRGVLPAMNLAELEGLAELINILLNNTRAAITKKV